MDFDAFWELYPRKVAKADARKAWKRRKPEEQGRAILALHHHAVYWAATGTEPQYIPHPATWLNGERYDDELQMPTFEKAGDWWRTDKGVEGKARELNMTARPGEEMSQFRERVIAAARGAIRRVA